MRFMGNDTEEQDFKLILHDSTGSLLVGGRYVCMYVCVCVSVCVEGKGLQMGIYKWKEGTV